MHACSIYHDMPDMSSKFLKPTGGPPKAYL